MQYKRALLRANLGAHRSARHLGAAAGKKRRKRIAMHPRENHFERHDNHRDRQAIGRKEKVEHENVHDDRGKQHKRERNYYAGQQERAGNYFNASEQRKEVTGSE
jgi:hypothetical protein